MNSIRKIQTMKNTIDLDNFVTHILEVEYPKDDRFYSESYGETADRIENSNEKLAYLLRIAEKKWIELENKYELNIFCEYCGMNPISDEPDIAEEMLCDRCADEINGMESMVTERGNNERQKAIAGRQKTAADQRKAPA